MPYLHHLLLHFPLTLALGAALMAIYGVAVRKPGPQIVALWLLVATAVVAVPAATTGLLSESHAIEEAGPSDILQGHKNAALLATVLSALVAVWAGWALRGTARAHPRYLVPASLLVAGGMGLTGYQGGEFVHPGMAPWATEGHTHGSSAGEDHEHAGNAVGHEEHTQQDAPPHHDGESDSHEE